MSTFSDTMSAARKIGNGARVPVTVVTNQRGGEVSYATGSLDFEEGRLAGRFFLPERLSTTPGSPLEYLFSDRVVDIAPPAPNQFGEFNPFSLENADKLGLSLSSSLGATTAHFTLLSWGNGTFTVPLIDAPGVLVGSGAPVGHGADAASYVISFGTIVAPPR